MFKIFKIQLRVRNKHGKRYISISMKIYCTANDIDPNNNVSETVASRLTLLLSTTQLH